MKMSPSGCRSVARNLLGVWGTEVPSGVQAGAVLDENIGGGQGKKVDDLFSVAMKTQANPPPPV